MPSVNGMLGRLCIWTKQVATRTGPTGADHTLKISLP